MKVYYCKHCHNIILYIENQGVPIVCCGEKMIELIPNSIVASIEKHLPVVTILNDKITVKMGVMEHPMINDHFIKWIIINRKHGYSIKYLNPFDKPEATFYYDNDVVSVYAYCNIHGLWEYKL